MPASYEKRILRVLNYIHENPAGDLSLDRLADVAAMSRFHWHRVFHAMTGETCAQSVRRIRLHRAAAWLIHQDWSIADIAACAGYPNVQSFTRAFSEAFDISPGAFRKTGRLGPRPTQKSKGSFKMFTVEMKQIPARRLAAIFHKGAYMDSGSCYKNLASTASSLQLWPEVQGMIGVHYDDPNVVAEADLRCHAGLVISPSTTLPEGLEEVHLAGGDHAVLRFKGPYTAIKIAYDYLYGEWLPHSGRDPADAPCYESYLNAPVDTRPDDLLTDICLPIAPKA
ncbi:MAG: AraC family transcriptional regulator [Alphaproteobacteria bacterium]|nr:AraC family transcriptional regulator [Alphaproteobacteria bacterium]